MHPQNYNLLGWCWSKEMPYSENKQIPNNINYTSKDFSTIKADLIEYTKSYFPDTYKDFNETSPGMMLIELASYVGDVLSYYIDYNYKESLPSTLYQKLNNPSNFFWPQFHKQVQLARRQ